MLFPVRKFHPFLPSVRNIGEMYRVAIFPSVKEKRDENVDNKYE